MQYKLFTPTEASKDQFVAFEYKGYTILSSVANVPEKHPDNLFIVQKDGSSFIVGLDDSKRCGYRISYPHNLEDAIDYVDWRSK